MECMLVSRSEADHGEPSILWARRNRQPKGIYDG